MKCDYCLEEIKEGAAACPHCTREQLWSVDARLKKAEQEAKDNREANVGCVMKGIGVVVAIFVGIMIIGSVSRSIEKNTQEKELKTQNCPLVVAAGRFKTVEDCVSGTTVAELKAYIDHVDLRCAINTKSTATYLEDKKTCIADKLKSDTEGGKTILEGTYAD